MTQQQHSARCGWCQYPVPERLLPFIAQLCTEICCSGQDHPVELSHPVGHKDHDVHRTKLTIFHDNSLPTWRINLQTGFATAFANVSPKNASSLTRYQELFKILCLQPCFLSKLQKHYGTIKPKMVVTKPNETRTTDLSTCRYQIPPIVMPIQSLEDLLVLRVFDRQTQSRLPLPCSNEEIVFKRGAMIVRNQIRYLLDMIQHADGVIMFGYLASGQAVFNALASKKRVLILLQKKDYMLANVTTAYARRFQQHVQLLQGREFTALHLATTLPWLQHCLPPNTRLGPLRCLGVCQNNQNAHTIPLLHDKCMIALKQQHGSKERYIPTSVWISTDNFTENACRSIGTGVMIDDAKVAQRKCEIVANYLLSSESVPWQRSTIHPEWRHLK